MVKLDVALVVIVLDISDVIAVIVLKIFWVLVWVVVDEMPVRKEESVELVEEIAVEVKKLGPDVSGWFVKAFTVDVDVVVVVEVKDEYVNSVCIKSKSHVVEVASGDVKLFWLVCRGSKVIGIRSQVVVGIIEGHVNWLDVVEVETEVSGKIFGVSVISGTGVKGTRSKVEVGIKIVSVLTDVVDLGGKVSISFNFHNKKN